MYKSLTEIAWSVIFVEEYYFCSDFPSILQQCSELSSGPLISLNLRIIEPVYDFTDTIIGFCLEGSSGSQRAGDRV